MSATTLLATELRNWGSKQFFSKKKSEQIPFKRRSGIFQCIGPWKHPGTSRISWWKGCSSFQLLFGGWLWVRSFANPKLGWVEDNFFSSAWTASLCGFLVSVFFCFWWFFGSRNLCGLCGLCGFLISVVFVVSAVLRGVLVFMGFGSSLVSVVCVAYGFSWFLGVLWLS